MTTRAPWFASGCVLGCFALACSGNSDGRLADLEQENAALKAKVLSLEAQVGGAGHAAGAGLPASLDAQYPPRAPQPFNATMMSMAVPFEAMVADFFEHDAENAALNYEAFVARYKQVRELVPEWTQRFPLEPVEALGPALASGDPGKVMPAVGKVGAICHACHADNMPAAQFKYHWNDTSGYQAKDPVTGQSIGYAQLMQFLSTSFVAVGSNLAQGQKEAARKQFEAFQARFALLKEACEECHASERRYFVDASVTELIDKLGAELAKDAPAPKVIRGVTQEIGEESCHKCHLVHLPAALSKAHDQ